MLYIPLDIPNFVSNSDSRAATTRAAFPVAVRLLLGAAGLAALATAVATRAKVVPIATSMSAPPAAALALASSAPAPGLDLNATSGAQNPALQTATPSVTAATTVRRRGSQNDAALAEGGSPHPTAKDDVKFSAFTRSQPLQYVGAFDAQSALKRSAAPSSVVLQPQRTSSSIRNLVNIPGVAFSATVINDASSGSGVTSGATAVRSFTQLELLLDLDSLFGWHGLTFAAHHSYKHGKDGSGEAGFVQGFSNIDAEDFNTFGEVFLEQQLLEGRFRLKVGRLDFNSEFAGVDNGGDFLNSSMGYSPSIAAAPTYQAPSTAINAIAQLTPHLSLLGGLFDGSGGAPAPEGGSSRFAVVQANEQWSLGQRDLPGRFGVGMFRHTGLFAPAIADDAASAADVHGVSGWYATLDQTLWHGHARSADAEDDRPAIAAFAQYGKSDPHVSGIHSHSGGGLTFSGMVPLPGANVIGIGSTRARWEDGRESVKELFVKQPLFSRLVLEFDVQGVDRLSFNGEHQHGKVYMMRTVVTF